MSNTFEILARIKKAEKVLIAQVEQPSAYFAHDYPLIRRLVFNENLAAVGAAEDRGGWRVRLRYARQILYHEIFDRQRAAIGKNDIVFLTPSTGRRFEGPAGWYDATVEAIAADDPNRRSFCYEVPAFGTYRNRKARPSYYLGLPEIGYRILRRAAVVKRRVPAALLTDITRFKQLLEAEGLQARALEIGAYTRAHIYLHDRADSFETQLRRMQPQAVFTYPWYGQINMAMLLAANRMGLRTVDCQHGMQGRLHAAYTDWPGFSLKSPLFPQRFFVWSTEEKTWLETWIGPERSAHVTGIPWLGISQATIAQDPHCQAYEQALASSNRSGVILVSLQPNRPDFIAWLMQVLAQPQAQNYTWVVRNHPGNQSQQAALSRQLGPFAMVLPLDICAKAPLICELRSCDLHITDYSSVVTEASFVGIHSLMLTQREDLFAHERRLGLAHSIGTDEVFWEDVENLMKRRSPAVAVNSSVNAALDAIL